MFRKIERSAAKCKQIITKKYFLEENPNLPLVIELVSEDSSVIDSDLWIEENKEKLLYELSVHGAILFRGFHIDENEKLQKFTLGFVDELLPYVEKRSPRTTLAKNVFSSTIYPEDQHIHFHNTTSFSHQWPMKIWFSCFKPAEQLGHTPISDCRKTLSKLSKALRKKFEKYGVMYVRNFNEQVGLPWQHTFDTSEHKEVEIYCKKHSIAYEWIGEDALRTKQIRHAIATHPKTGDKVWFNQGHHFNVLSLDKQVSSAMLNNYSEENLPRNSYFGNGDKITQDMIDEITECYKEYECSFPWQKGDVMMLDNMLTAHARTPYKGDRLIALTLGEMYEPVYNGGGVI